MTQIFMIKNDSEQKSVQRFSIVESQGLFFLISMILCAYVVKK